ncbi:hypothetical protein CQ047_01720 [Microbacterium sp. MYb72]|nr:hypothetical protein CQ047_01720 [Microbacterium sp. MYb72]
MTANSPSGSESGRTFRPLSGPVTLVLAGLIALFLLGDAVVRAGWAQAALLAPWVLLALWVLYEISFVSRVQVDDLGASVHNMLRRTSFGWSRVKDIDLRWQLEFTFEDGSKTSCYGGPARSRPRRSRMREDDPTPPRGGEHDLADITALWRTASFEADAPIVRSWDLRALIALGAIVVWAVASVLIANS